MKLSQLYSNQEIIFPSIQFRQGLNVVFAKVKNPKIQDRDSHNLGKSFLARVIDFCLLGKIDKNHPFKKKVFQDFCFYLEMEAINGVHITLSRSTSKKSDVNIFMCEHKNIDVREIAPQDWTYKKLSIDRAKNILDNYFDLQILAPFDYRKGLGYVLRKQDDYSEIFKISNFRYGADRYWKPFLARILGFEEEVIIEKYALEEEVKHLNQSQRNIENEVGRKSDEYDSVRGELEIRTASLEKLRKEVEGFSFREIEAEISDTAINTVESRISDLTTKRYKINYEVSEIEKSLSYKIEFDLDEVFRVFEEANIYFPEQLAHDYQELLDFNERISSGRAQRLRSLRQNLSNDLLKIESEIQELDRERARILSILNEKKTFEKFKGLQSLLIEKEKEVVELSQRLSQLDQATVIQQKIEEKKQDVVEKIREIRTIIYSENDIYRHIRTTFSAYVERVLNAQIMISSNVNQNGNIDFNVQVLDGKEESVRETSEGEGSSYRKILCVCFDLALLSVHSRNNFYRFVYHDGVFEGLDNRKKIKFLDLVNEVCRQHDIQYILTVIDSDLPRNEFDNKLLFEADEIIRELNDQGDEGRLFRMPAF